MITVFTDGSCVYGNPGNAAGAYVAMRDGVLLEALGIPIGQSTNNRGEMAGAIQGLLAAARHAQPGEEVLLVSDSTYVVEGMRNARDRVARLAFNHDLWKEMADAADALAASEHALHVKWVRGHKGNPGNTLSDRLARAAAREQRKHTMDMVFKNDCLVSPAPLICHDNTVHPTASYPRQNTTGFDHPVRRGEEIAACSNAC